MKKLTLAFLLFVSSSVFAGAKIDAELSTYFVESMKKTIALKMAHRSSSRWVIEVWNECPSYPCNPEDFKTSTAVTPTVIEDSREGDGRLVLRLNDQMTVIHQPNILQPGRSTTYSLEYKENATATPVTLPLYMEAWIATE